MTALATYLFALGVLTLFFALAELYRRGRGE